jgi:hypothetical protein
MENKELSSWDGFTGANFLKPADVKDVTIPYVCVDVELEEENHRPRVHLECNEEKVIFDLNVTNANALKNLGIKSPRACIGKKIYFRKVMVMSPKTKTEVSSLRIERIE